MTRDPIARAIVIAVLGVAACGVALPSSAQSLGAAAQKEAARRKAVKGPAKVYTNDSLRPESSDPVPTPPGNPGQAAPAGAATPPAQASPAQEPPAPDLLKDQEYWRKRMADARLERDRNAFLMEAMQSRINALAADFSARDDPYQRAKLFEDRQRALAELERMKQEQSAIEKRIADIEEEARRANVPAGWIR
jgi:hypothetical protein